MTESQPRADDVTAASIRERIRPRLKATPCLYDEIDELDALREDVSDEAFTEINERLVRIGHVLKDRLNPRYPDCPHCGADKLTNDRNLVLCTACKKNPPDDVKQEWIQQSRRIWGARGHGQYGGRDAL